MPSPTVVTDLTGSHLTLMVRLENLLQISSEGTYRGGPCTHQKSAGKEKSSFLLDKFSREL